MSKTHITVRFSDIDMAGNVHNSKYLSFFEQARIDFLTEISGLNWEWRKRGLLIGGIEVDYINPLHLRDEVYIKTSCDHAGNKSFTLCYTLYKKTKDEDILCNRGRSILICMNFETNVSVPIYQEWRKYLMKSAAS